jgi:DNA-binding response OmpR family regulator
MLTEYLGGHGHAVACAENGVAMRAALAAQAPDVVLLDIGLPGEDGIALARFVRERYDVGIVMVSAAGGVVDRIVGLEVGADDYIAKPFDPRELLARVRSVLRRLEARTPAPGRGEAAPETAPAAARVPFGRCRLDIASRQLLDHDGRDVPITAMEFDLLKTFIEHPNQVADPRPPADPDAQPQLGAVRPLDRHPHRAAAPEGGGGSGASARDHGRCAAWGTCSCRDPSGVARRQQTGNNPAPLRCRRDTHGVQTSSSPSPLTDEV